MSRRDLTDEERQDWNEATKDTRRAKTKKRPAPETPSLPAAIPKPPLPTRESLAVKPAKKLAAPAAPLNILPRREAHRLFKPHVRTQARIDLHGMTQTEAHAALNDFITHCHAAGKRHVAVITGKGSRGVGVLRRAVPHWLELPALRTLVVAVAHAPPEKGGEGVLHVLLKRPS